MKSRIRELRHRYGISQIEFAEAIGTTRQTIISIETERFTTSLPTAYKISHFFALTIEEVFDFSEIDRELWEE